MDHWYHPLKSALDIPGGAAPLRDLCTKEKVGSLTTDTPKCLKEGNYVHP